MKCWNCHHLNNASDADCFMCGAALYTGTPKAHGSLYVFLALCVFLPVFAAAGGTNKLLPLLGVAAPTRSAGEDVNVKVRIKRMPVYRGPAGNAGPIIIAVILGVVGVGACLYVTRTPFALKTQLLLSGLVVAGVWAVYLAFAVGLAKELAGPSPPPRGRGTGGRAGRRVTPASAPVARSRVLKPSPMPDSFSNTLYFVAGAGLSLLVLYGLAAWQGWQGVRFQRRLIANLENPDRQDCTPARLPRRLRRWLARVRPELEADGFRDLLTGVGRGLATGHHDSYSHVFASADGMATWVFLRMRNHFGFNLVIPRLERWLSPVTLAAALETVFEDGSVLVTATRPMPRLAGIPDIWVLELPEGMPLAAVWQAHRGEVVRLAAEKNCGWRPLNTRDAYLAKERLQRRRLARHETRLLAAVEATRLWGDADAYGMCGIDLSAVPADQREALLEGIYAMIRAAEPPLTLDAASPVQEASGPA